uniref:Integral membrane protein n=1 Tax=Streptomyces sp. NBC_01401 TaxID=2903854 RepID=A0AAU3GMS4_9ACTN
MSDPLARLYPAAYRAAHGQEIVDVHREMTADLPRPARLRADADLAAHALRVRLGLDSASPAGRFFSLAGPFALAAGAVDSGLRLARWYAGLVLSPAPARIQLSAMGGAESLYVLLSLVVCVGAVIALTGRWRPGVGLAVGGLLGTAVQWTTDAYLYGDAPLAPVAALLTVAVVVAVPPDGRGDGRLSAAAGTMAAVGWFPVVAVNAGTYTGAFGVTTDYGAWPLLVLALTGAVLAVRARSSGLRETGAMAAASPPLIASSYATAWGDLRPALGALLLLSAVAALTACLQAVRGRRN